MGLLLFRRGYRLMSAMSVYGQEDDDFAYQDEHIEMESENQEHDDLDDGEFDSRPALIRAEARSTNTPIRAIVAREPQPATVQPIGTQRSTQPAAAPAPVLPV